MTAHNHLTERMRIEARAIDLAWSLNKLALDETVFGRDGYRFTVSWRYAVATKAVLSKEGKPIFTQEGEGSGKWVIAQMEAWRLACTLGVKLREVSA